MQEFLSVMWGYLIITAPYLWMGFLAGGLIHQFLGLQGKAGEWIKRSGPKNIFYASLLGIPLPLCSCSVIPAAVTLRKQGAGTGTTSSFLISTPESGVDSMLMTYAVMDLPMTIMRPIAAFLTSFSAGLFQEQFNNVPYVEPETQEKTSCCHHKNDHDHDHDLKSKNFLGKVLEYGLVNLVDDMVEWLSFGLILGGVLTYFLPVDTFDSLNGLTGRLLVLGLGIPFYICASASTPIAASLVIKGMSPGTALIFLLVGPATNISNLSVLQKYIGKKGVIINIITIAVVSLGLSFLVDFIYEYFQLETQFKIHHLHEHHGHAWWQHLLSVGLVLLLLQSAWRKFKKRA